MRCRAQHSTWVAEAKSWAPASTSPPTYAFLTLLNLLPRPLLNMMGAVRLTVMSAHCLSIMETIWKGKETKKASNTWCWRIKVNKQTNKQGASTCGGVNTRGSATLHSLCGVQYIVHQSVQQGFGVDWGCVDLMCEVIHWHHHKCHQHVCTCHWNSHHSDTLWREAQAHCKK